MCRDLLRFRQTPYLGTLLGSLLLPLQLAQGNALPLAVRVEGVVESTGHVPTMAANSPFTLDLVFHQIKDEHRFLQSADFLFDVDITLTAAGVEQTWASQFGAMSLSQRDGDAGDLLLDLGSDLQIFLSKAGPGGSLELEFESGISFLTDGDLHQSRLAFFFEPGGIGLFDARVTSLTAVPEPTSGAMLWLGSLFGLFPSRRLLARRQPSG